MPDEEPRPAEEVLAGLPWRRVARRRGAKGTLAARFAAARVRVRVGDGATRGNNRHLPGGEAGPVDEWRSTGERKYHLGNLAPGTPLRALAAAVEARWVRERAHQQPKQELGLGRSEGRSWTGPHRHALMACVAFAHLQHLRLAGHPRSGPGETPRRLPGPPPSPGLPAARRAIVRRPLAHLAPPVRCPRCRRKFKPPDAELPR